ncbi:retrotransposon protein, putative, ty1-copia subclass [Tanacetum coccineum]
MLDELRRMFEKPQAVEIYDLVDSLHSCKQAPGKSVSAHVLEMKGYMDQLQALGKPYDNDMAINLINMSLNKDFGDFVRNFNMHCVRKTVLAIQKGRVNKPKPQANKKGKGKGKADKNKQVVAYQPKPKQNPPQKKENPKKDQACHYCNVVGHWKRNCPLYLEELRTNKNKKAEHGAAPSGNLFMIELFNLTHKLNSWVYDTGCGIHICNTLQGFRVKRNLSYGEQYLHVGNGAQADVEAIGVFNLVIPSGLVLSLNNCHYAPSIVRGVVSFSCLLDLGFVHTVTSNGISVSLNGILYFSAISVNGVFEIDMNDNVSKYNNNSIFSINKKRKLDLNSSYLWHSRLAHIGKTRMQKLQREGLLESINDGSYDKCESCISGKMTKKPFNNNIERATDLLGLIHTDVCEPFRHVSRKGASYFLTFTDDFSHYGYVYLLKHIDEVFETFKVFKSEVELQLEKKIKALRSDRDMVRSMFNLTTLPLSFWDYALESAVRILNMVPTKKVDKTPYEIWHGKVPNLSYLKVWGCEAYVKRDSADKLQQRSVKCIFVGYPKETMGYYFYFPPENKVIVARYGDFLERDLISQEFSGRDYDLEDDHMDTLPSENTSVIPVEPESLGPPPELIPVRRVLRGFLLHRSSINNSASLSNKFGEFYFIFKFGISGLLHQVVTAIADRIREMLKKFGLEESKPMKTPMYPDTKLTKDEECESVDSTKYQGMIGTTHLRLWYPKGTVIETVVYADSDHAGDYVDRKSTSGICTFMGCCLTSCFSKKQTALAISTTKAEYVSAGKACQQALWMKQALIDYDVRLDDIPIMCDNKGTIDLSKNLVQHSQTKHIEIRHHFLRDNVQKGHISIEKVPSIDNIADILMKPLKCESFNHLCLGLGMMEYIP